MSKEPMNTAALPEVPRRRRRIDSQVSKGNISYQELLGIHLRQCRIRNLATITIDGYRNASRYFLDFAGNGLMCGDITQDLINETTANELGHANATTTATIYAHQIATAKAKASEARSAVFRNRKKESAE